MNLFLMFFTTFFIHLIIATEMNIIGPLAPFLSQYFNIKDSSVIMFNIGYSLIGLLIPILGVFADRYGKKKSMIIALTSYICGTLISGFAHNPIVFAFGRIFIGVGYFSLSGTNLSYLSEFIPYESRGKASGVLRTAFGTALLLSPIYATNMVNKYNNLQSVYLPLTIIGAICLALLFKLPETKKSEDIKFNIKDLMIMLKNPINYKSLMVLFLILVSPSLLLSFSGIYFTNNFNMDQVQVGFIYTIIAIGSVLGIIFAGLLADRIGKEKLSRFFYTLLFITTIPLFFLKSQILIIGMLIIFALGLDGGCTSYQALCSEINPKNRGTFMSLFYTVNAITVTLFSILGPIFYNLGGYKLLIAISMITSFAAIKIQYSIAIEQNIFQKNSIDPVEV